MQNWFCPQQEIFLKFSPWHLFMLNFCRLLFTQFVKESHHSKENFPIDQKDFCLMILTLVWTEKMCWTSNNGFWPALIKIIFLNMISMLFFWNLFILYSTGWDKSKDVLNLSWSWLVVVLLSKMSKMNFIFWKFLSSHLHTLWDTYFLSSFQTGTIWKPV